MRRGRSADKFSFLGPSQVPSWGWIPQGRGAFEFPGTGETTTGFTAQQVNILALCSLDGGRWTPTEQSITGLPQGVGNPMRAVVNWQGLEPQAGMYHGHGLAKQSQCQRLAGSRTLSFPLSRSDKISMSSINYRNRLHLTLTYHLTTAGLP